MPLGPTWAAGAFTCCATESSAAFSCVAETMLPCASTTVSLTLPSGLTAMLTLSPGFWTLVWFAPTYSASRIVPSSLMICPSLTVVTVLFWAGRVNVPFCNVGVLAGDSPRGISFSMLGLGF